MTIVQFPPSGQPPSVVGPAFSGHRVIVDGRVIPRMKCHQHGEEITLVLDGRFSIVVRAAEAHNIAWMIANALAIGAGYSHMGADAPGRPFPPGMLIGTIEGHGRP